MAFILLLGQHYQINQIFKKVSLHLHFIIYAEGGTHGYRLHGVQPQHILSKHIECCTDNKTEDNEGELYSQHLQLMMCNFSKKNVPIKNSNKQICTFLTSLI